LVGFSVQEHHAAHKHQQDHCRYTELDNSLHESRYSSCSATIGLTAAARLAGIRDASTPAVINTARAVMAVSKSTAGRLKNPGLPSGPSIVAMAWITSVPTTRPA